MYGKAYLKEAKKNRLRVDKLREKELEALKNKDLPVEENEEPVGILEAFMKSIEKYKSKQS
jgi:hypothetical protein